MEKRVARPNKQWRPRYVWALVIGMLLLGLGALLWQQFANATFSDRLIRKMPTDSVSAGVARLSALDSVSLKQYAQGANVQASTVPALMDALSGSGVTKDQLSQALDDQFAWATTPRGNLAVFTVANEGALRAASDKLAGRLDNRQAAQLDELKADTGTLRGTTVPIVTAVSGRELYVASNPELIKAAVKEQDGFTSLPQFTELSSSLPGASGGYVFFNTPVVKTKLGFEPPLVGIAWSPRRDHVSLTMRTTDTGTVQNGLAATSGKLLPETDQAIGAIEGRDIASYLELLEEQRQETDLPRVITLQNGLANLSRLMGVDVTERYLGAADGRFVYARFMGGDGKPSWYGAVEFGSPEQAQQTATELINELTAKVPVPLQRIVVRQLPDGTESREIEFQGKVPMAFVDYQVAGRTGKAANLPSIGVVHVMTEGPYMILSGTPEGTQRMLNTLAAEHTGVGSSGPLAVRLRVPDAYRLLESRDVLFDWVLATRPSGGSFELKPSGDLSGTLEFNEAS